MSWKTVLSLLFFFVVVVLLVFYWILPFGRVLQFGYPAGNGNSNFSIGNSSLVDMQFYENMRYQNKEITYHMGDCPIAKTDEMNRAFDIIENLTVVSFKAVPEGQEEISITCESSARVAGRTFIAGEGGVTNVTATDNFNVIFNGMILLLRETKCSDPIVGIHELLHSMGFDHSSNPENMMYPTVNCGQTIGEDVVNQINNLYSFESLADVSIESASAEIHGNYLDLSLTLKNNGLIGSADSRLVVYADDRNIKELDVDSMSVGAGREISLTNIFLLRSGVEEIKLVVEYSPSELDKENNVLVLQVKK